MNRRYFGLFILWLLTSAGFSQNNIIDEVAWIVGDEAILFFLYFIRNAVWNTEFIESPVSGIEAIVFNKSCA